MNRHTHPRRSLSAIGTLATVALVGGLMVAGATSAAAASPANGQTEASAAASCWEVKQTTPSAASGIYWLVTPQLGAPEQFYCDQTTDGGGWVLVGRGREDWATSNEGFGTPAQVRDVITGTAAFAPRQLSSEKIDALLNGQGVSSLAEGIRLKRATNAAGTAWQDVTFTFASPRTSWTWMFENEQRINRWTIGTRTGTGGTTMTFGTGTALERVQTVAGSAQGWLPGFGFGTSTRGSNDANTYLWAPNTSAGNPRPFTQVFLRPKLMSSTVFTTIPDAGTPAITKSAVADSLAQRTVWGVSGLGAGPSSLEGSNEVSAFTESNGIVYVGGNFLYPQKTSAGGNRVQQPYLAAFDVNTGELISSFRPTLNNQVKALAALPDGRIAVGGYFTQVNGQPVAGLTVLNPTTGATDTTFTGKLRNFIGGGVPVVRSLDVQDGWLYAGGNFTHSTGGTQVNDIYSRNGARLSVTNGTPHPSWNPGLNGTAISIDAAPQGDRVYFAGFFTSSNETFADKGAAISTANSSVIPWNVRFSNREGGRQGYQQAVQEVGGKVWLGGSEHMLFSYARDNFALVGSNITISGGDFQAIDSRDGIVYAGCHCFHTNYNGATQWGNVGTAWKEASKINSIGAWDAATGNTLAKFSPIMSSRNGGGAWAIFVDSKGTLWVGGDYNASIRDGFVKQWSGGFVRFARGDTQVPTTPTALTATTSGANVTLSWGASTDNGAVRYEVLRNDRVIRTVTTTNTTLPAEAGARYFVRSADAAGNRSASTPVAGTTTTPPPPTTPTDPTNTVVIPAGAPNWSYWYQTDAPAAAWRTTGFNASAWSTGTAPLGWGHASIATELTAAAPKPVTSYFRKSFQVQDATKVTSLALTTRADDGIVIYVNGTEVARTNIDAGPVTHTTYANAAVSAGVAAGNPLSFEVPGTVLVTGTNVITAEVHSNYRATPSASFDLAATLRIGTAVTPPPVTPPAPEPEPEPEPEPGPGPGTPEPATFVPAGSQWSYRFEDAPPAATWNQPAFDASTWQRAAAPLGWGTSPTIATQLTTTVTPKPSSVYFRTTFDLAAGSVPSGGVRLTTYADDGILVFVNGVEVGRSNLIAGTITHNTYANSAPNTQAAIATPVTFDVPASALTAGANTIAVQVVSNYRASPSVSFEMSAVSRP